MTVCGRIAERWHTVKEGEMIIMPANRPQALKAREHFKMLLVLAK